MESRTSSARQARRGAASGNGKRPEADATAYHLAAIVESSEDAIVGVSPEGLVTSWNDGAERLLGYAADEICGRPISSTWPERSLERFRGAHEKLMRGERIPAHECRRVRKDGSVVEVSVTTSPVKDPSGRVVGLASVLRDITDRREAEAATRLLATIVESSDDAILATEIDGAIKAWNPGAERLLGYRAEQMIGQSVARIWCKDDHALFARMQSRLIAGERVPPFETRAIRADGSPVDVSVAAFPLKDAEGRVTGVSAIARDISERKRVERELAETRLRSERVFEAAPIGMALLDPDGRWLTVNRALCRFLERTEAELLATDFQSVTHPDDLDADVGLLHSTLRGEREGYEMEKRYLLPSGAVAWGHLSVSLLRDESGAPLHFVRQVQDITERKEADEELLRYSEHLNELALQDPLTGLRNYRDFHAMVDTELQRSRRYDTEWSVVLFDVDGFRAINAAGGHFEGDRVLRDVAAAIEGARRSSDLAARIGSDEFALVLAGTAGDGATRTAERIIAQVSARAGVSVSYGTASWPADGDSKDRVLVRADSQLQAAKPRPQKPLAGSGSQPAPQVDGAAGGIQRILELARDQLGMDLAYMTEFTDSSQVYRGLAGDAPSFEAEPGGAMPLEATCCLRMVERRIPNAVADTAATPELASLPLTSEAGIGSYVGVPLELSDGRLYGSLCVVSHGRAPELAERQVELMRFLAGLIVHQIEHAEEEAGERRSHAELAGIHALLSALGARDHYTGEHSKTVVQLAIRVARRLGLADGAVQEVEHVALLHDIGKVGMPDSVLQKRGPLNDQEWELMRQHPAIGARILAGTETLSHLAPAVKAEHERFDGGGYPDGLRGEDIPLASRIAFACDAYHAMTTDRPYRAALTPEKARAELVEGAGSQFDPAVVQALLAEIDGEPAPQPERGRPTSALAVNVLDESTLGQIPVWAPHPGAGSAAALGDVRAVCRRCGTHVSAVGPRAALSRSCGNCGGYELDLVEV